MEEQRKTERLKEFNELTITIMSQVENLSKVKKMFNYIENISVSGAKMRGNIVLPVDTLLKMDFKLKNLKKNITAIGKIKWIKIIIEDKYYETGVEFVDTPGEAIEKLGDYITWKKKAMGL